MKSKNQRNYNNSWKPLFIKEENVSPLTLKAGNFYKIVTYKYSDGTTKTLAGVNESFLFVLGRYKKNKNEYISAIKLKYVEPKIFFRDLKLIFNPYPQNAENIEKIYENTKNNKNDEFSKLLRKFSKDGKNLLSLIKSKNKIYEGYREYILNNVKISLYLDIDPVYLKTVLVKNSQKSQFIKNEKEMTNYRKEEVAKKLF